MKCDELKDRWFWAYPTESVDCDGITGSAHEVYGKSEVDEAITELKDEINRKEGVGQRWFERCMEARTENIRLKRALWMARGWRAKERQRMLPNNKEFYTWQEIERKCRAKAEEYK